MSYESSESESVCAVTKKTAPRQVLIQTEATDFKPVPSKTTADIREGFRLTEAKQQAAAEIGTCPPTPHLFPPEIEFINGPLLCPNQVEYFLPPTLQATEQAYQDQAMIDLIQVLLRTDTPCKNSSPFRWHLDSDSAQHNQDVLASYDYDIEACYNSHPHSIIHPGSEFRDVHLLEPLLHLHSQWTAVKEMLTKGADMHRSEEVPLAARQEENQALLEYRNHKGARENMEVVLSAVLEDIHHGFAIALPVGAERKLPHAMMCPVGTVTQTTMTNAGDVVTRIRLAHDQTFIKLAKSKSVNMITDLKQFQCMIYGWCFVRLLHQIVALRLAYPTTIIFGIKGDIKSVFHLLHYNWKSAQQCIIYLLGYLVMWLRLCFGGTGCPWCAVGEMAVDLGNDLLSNSAFQWDAIDSQYKEMIREPTRLAKDTPIAKALPTMFSPPLRAYGYLDIFVDDIIGVVIDAPSGSH